MQRPSVSSSIVMQAEMTMKHLIILSLVIAGVLVSTGCVGSREHQAPAWNLSPDGSIRFSVPEVPIYEHILEEGENLTVKEITFRGWAGDVQGILVCPKNPIAFLVWAPGANNPAPGYLDYMKYFSAHDIGVLIMDIRGNGGVTEGYPMDIERDAGLFLKGEWPQWYLITGDMIAARQYLQAGYPHLPVYAAGDSNGGRYAALAAGSDHDFAGYLGVSTSGFHHMGDQYASPLKEFLLSIDPEIQVQEIIPRQVILFHAPDDPVIPFKEGEALAESGGGGVVFIPFNGTHGVNREVDDQIITLIHRSLMGSETKVNLKSNRSQYIPAYSVGLSHERSG